MARSQVGIDRALEPAGSMPYAAWRLDPSPPLRRGEALVDVEALNIDSASFKQLLEEHGGDPDGVARRIEQIVTERGKMHNPVTGSGGVLIGTVHEVSNRDDLAAGTRLVTLTSLTTTPLRLDRVIAVDTATHQVRVKGTAILFRRSPYAVLDGTLPDRLALAVLDVCGAPAQAARLAEPGRTIVVAGAAGKSGLLVTWVAASRGARVIGLVRDESEAARLRGLVRDQGEAARPPGLPVAAEVLIVDATDPHAVQEAVESATEGAMADVVFNCINAPGAETSCILAAKPGGLAYFFSMATSFQAVALCADAVGANVDLMIGNGFADGHAELALSLVRESAALRATFEEMLG